MATALAAPSLASISTRALRASHRISFDLLSSAKQAWLRKRPLRFSAAGDWRKLADLLRSGMVASHLAGLNHRRVFLAHHASLSLADDDPIFGSTIKYLQKRLSLDPDTLDSMQAFYGAHALKVVNTASQYAERRLQQKVLDLTQRGAHVREGVDELNDTFDALGLSPMKDRQLETIFRTQTKAAYSAGQWMADADDAVQEILWGYSYSGVMDDREREDHVALEGVTLPASNEFWQTAWPPNGWNCRCEAVPLFDGDESSIVAPPDDYEDLVDDGFGQNLGAVMMQQMKPNKRAAKLKRLKASHDVTSEARDDHGRFAALTAIGSYEEKVVATPTDPATVAAYSAMKQQVLQQYHDIVAKGYKFKWVQHDPYSTSQQMWDDVDKTKTLAVYADSSDLPKDHPLAEVSPVEGQTYNTLFRGVHDFNGHYLPKHSFGPNGELGAFQAHSRMFNDAALPALAAETLAQNAWVNFGPHHPERLAPRDRPFAPQKAYSFPLEVAHKMAHDDFTDVKLSDDQHARHYCTDFRRPRHERQRGSKAVVASLEAAFDESESRDDHGRWTAVGQYYNGQDTPAITVTINPTKDDIRRMVHSERYQHPDRDRSSNELRYLYDKEKKQLHVWPAYDAIHAHIADQLHKERLDMYVGELTVDKAGKVVGELRPDGRPYHAGEPVTKGHRATLSRFVDKVIDVNRKELRLDFDESLHPRDHGKFAEKAGAPATPAFRSWFSDSNVTNADGTPHVVYHGTMTDLHDQFRTDAPDDKDFVMLDRGLGAHFAEDARVTDAFTVGEYARQAASDFVVSDYHPEQSWYRHDGQVLYDAGIPMLERWGGNGAEPIEPYDYGKHGSIYGLREKFGRDVGVAMIPPGGKVYPAYLSVQHPLVVKRVTGEMDQTAISRAVMNQVFPVDRQLFADAWGTTGRENGGKVWDDIKAGYGYNGGKYETFDSFDDVARNFSGMLNGKDMTARAKADLIKLGYDGIKYQNTSSNETRPEFNPTCWIVFHPEQVKSSIANKGQYDRTKQNITASEEARDPHGRWVASATVPLEPGTTPIPAGNIRLYHYTGAEPGDAAGDDGKHAAAERLRTNGIDIKKAIGHTYGEPDVVWASTQLPNPGKVYAEFSVAPDDKRWEIGKPEKDTDAREYEKRNWDSTFGGSIKPSEIVAVHEPWHSRFRYIASHPEIAQQTLAGHNDELLTYQGYGPAIQKYKQLHGK